VKNQGQRVKNQGRRMKKQGRRVKAYIFSLIFSPQISNRIFETGVFVRAFVNKTLNVWVWRCRTKIQFVLFSVMTLWMIHLFVPIISTRVSCYLKVERLKFIVTTALLM
jgi:hypothetical protein